MAICVCCACENNDDCCQDGYFYNCGGSPYAGPFETAGECGAAALADGCPGGGQIPQCYCANIDNECCSDGVCRSVCEDEEFAP